MIMNQYVLLQNTILRRLESQWVRRMSDLISKKLLMKELEKKSVKDSVNNLSTTYTMKELAYIIHTLQTPLLPCPICGKEIDVDEDMYIPERDWKPIFLTLIVVATQSIYIVNVD